MFSVKHTEKKRRLWRTCVGLKHFESQNYRACRDSILILPANHVFEFQPFHRVIFRFPISFHGPKKTDACARIQGLAVMKTLEGPKQPWVVP